MTEHSPLSIDDVRALAAERHRFDDWLSALEARREATPEHVYARVHGDYHARRDQVLSKLHEQAPALADLLASLDERSTELTGRMAAQEDERTEAMLRHAVGEYDDSAWHAVRERVEASLQEMGGEHAALEEQRNDVRHLLSEARPVLPPPADIEPAVASEVASDVDGIAATTPDANPLEVEMDDAPSWMTEEVASPANASGAPESSATAPTEGDHAPERTISITETLAAIEADVVDDVLPTSEPDDDSTIRRPMSGGFERPNFWGTREAGVPAAEPSDAEPQDVYGDANPDHGVAADGGKTAPSADAFDELAFLRSVIDPQAQSPSVPKAPGTGAPQKTLRCTECGTMNLPTEWYCERCGGELATF